VTKGNKQEDHKTVAVDDLYSKVFGRRSRQLETCKERKEKEGREMTEEYMDKGRERWAVKVKSKKMKGKGDRSSKEHPHRQPVLHIVCYSLATQ
jgi:hypothetical protein